MLTVEYEGLQTTAYCSSHNIEKLRGRDCSAHTSTVDCADGLRVKVSSKSDSRWDSKKKLPSHVCPT